MYLENWSAFVDGTAVLCGEVYGDSRWDDGR